MPSGIGSMTGVVLKEENFTHDSNVNPLGSEVDAWSNKRVVPVDEGSNLLLGGVNPDVAYMTVPTTKRRSETLKVGPTLLSYCPIENMPRHAEYGVGDNVWLLTSTPSI